ncbi:MAG: helix-hairpin-helix domain-containing protein [Bacteroidales bacterium]|nr:helix-hairpin-helix domain-containing protein [Bacteroidales bacterium]
MVFRKFLKQWFGYTRGERAGSFILLIILLVILAIRALNSGRTTSLEEEGLTETISADSAAAGIKDGGEPLTGFSGYKNDIDRSGSTDRLNTGFAAGDNKVAAAVTEQGYLDSLYSFDPNTASQDKLLGLGLSERQVRTIINYRSTGARFDEPEDFRKIYGIDSEMQDRLLPYIIIVGESGQKRSDGLTGINKNPVKAGGKQYGNCDETGC